SAHDAADRQPQHPRRDPVPRAAPRILSEPRLQGRYCPHGPRSTVPFTVSNTPYPAAPALPGDAGGFSVLVVEDQPSVRAALVAELRRAGVSDIFEAPEGGAALHLFKAHRPDLVLLDIKLPGQDGYWVAQQMRESEA